MQSLETQIWNKYPFPCSDLFLLWIIKTNKNKKEYLYVKVRNKSLYLLWSNVCLTMHGNIINHTILLNSSLSCFEKILVWFLATNPVEYGEEAGNDHQEGMGKINIKALHYRIFSDACYLFVCYRYSWYCMWLLQLTVQVVHRVILHAETDGKVQA